MNAFPPPAMTSRPPCRTASLLLPAVCIFLPAVSAQETAGLTEDTTEPSGLQVVTLPASLKRTTVYKGIAVHHPALLHSVMADNGGATVAATSGTVTITEEDNVDFAALLDAAKPYVVEFHTADGDAWFASAPFPLNQNAWYEGKKAFTVTENGRVLSFRDAAASAFVENNAIVGYSIREATVLRDVAAPIQNSFAAGTATTADSVSVYTDDKGNVRKAYRAKSASGAWTSARLPSGTDVLNLSLQMGRQFAVTRKKGAEASVVLAGDVTTGSRSAGVRFKTERVATGQLAGQSLESTELGPQLARNGDTADLPGEDETAAWITCSYSAGVWSAREQTVPALDGLLVIKRGTADDARLILRSPFAPATAPAANTSTGER